MPVLAFLREPFLTSPRPILPDQIEHRLSSAMAAPVSGFSQAERTTVLSAKTAATCPTQQSRRLSLRVPSQKTHPILRVPPCQLLSAQPMGHHGQIAFPRSSRRNSYSLSKQLSRPPSPILQTVSGRWTDPAPEMRWAPGRTMVLWHASKGR